MALGGYTSNHNVIYFRKYHVVWTPKYRRSVLVGEVAKRCQTPLRQVAAKYDAEKIALALMRNRVHLLCEVGPPVGVPRLVKNIQGSSFVSTVGERL